MSYPIPDKVTVVSLSGGHPFHHLKQVSMKHGSDAQTPIKSRVELQPNGTKIIVPRGG